MIVDPDSSPRLPALGVDTTAIIHENLVVLLTFAFSWSALKHYQGWLRSHRWNYQDKDVFWELRQQRARRAIIELAVMFRALDKAKKIASHPYVTTHPSQPSYGDLYDRDGTLNPLPLWDVPNKIIHAESIDWDFADPKQPSVVCHAPAEDHERWPWMKATIHITSFAAVCGALAR